MRDQTLPGALRLFLAILALAVCALAGCATKPTVDWDRRVGNFTFDQAIAELGPPGKQTKLSNGKTVAAWVTHRSVASTFSIGSGPQDRVLRLTFDADGKLAACSKNY